ncbi:hypothetical protein IWX90DRAFT_388349 [Phyllosticta citrichinensis]|uniref:Uncharacterized protein n=1 Tax=Phyllosticta citrichinensis TaxID=1130410 RepID=A0ABR1XN18_9PEZI
MARKAAKSSSKGAVVKKPPPPPATAPPPFSQITPSLEAFVDTLDPTKIYITHIDTFPTDFKKQVFAIPAILNVLLVVVIVWRAYAAGPTYWEMVLAALGNETAASVTRETKTWGELATIASKRAAMFLFDYALLVGVGNWPLTFFVAPGQQESAASWRLRTGFREREVYVRASRGWGRDELLGDEAEAFESEDSPLFRTLILPAIERRFVQDKTGYVMMNDSWDLDYSAMVRATQLLDKKEIEEAPFRKSVWVYAGDGVGWCVWEVHKLDEASNKSNGAEDAGRRKIVAFKERLDALGKESLFFRWIEIVQFESSQPGGFTPERQQAAVKKAKELFDAQGIDFEKFVREVGGLNDLPGFDESSG